MKKVISIILACCMLECAGSVCYAAQEKTDMCQAEIILDGMGIIDGNFDGSKYLTRGEFVSMAVKTMKSDIASDEVPYDDVSEDNPYRREIAAAYLLGAAAPADKFYPDSEITYEQAAKILVNFLGYEYMAEQNGGFPGGYVSNAYSLGLFDGLTYRSSAGVSGAEGATLIRNAMESYYIEKSPDGQKYEKSENRYMNEYLDIYKERGIVTSDGIMDLNGENTADGKVKVGGAEYLQGKSDVAEHLGEDIVFYYRMPEDSEGTVLYAEPANQNKILTVMGEDISSKTTVSEFFYDDNGKTKSNKIAADVKVVYNGTAEFAYTREMLMPKEGFVKLIDNDSDKVIDAIISYDYDIGVVNNYNGGMRRIILKYSQNPIMLDDYSDVIIRKDGVKIEADKLAEWDVLNICKNGNRIIIDVSSNPVSGTIKSIYSQDNEKMITVDDTECKVSEKYISQSGELKSGEKGIFYTSILGNIVCANYGTTSRRNYSVMLMAILNDGLDAPVKFKLFKKDNTTETVNGAEKIKCDGVWKKAEDAVKYINNTGLYQVVVTDSNEKGEIISVDFAEDMTQTKDYRGYDDDNFTLDVNIEGGDGVRFYNNTGAGCHIQNGVVFFSIPQDKTNTSLYKAEGYKRVFDMDTTIKNIKYYDLDRFNRPGCVVISDYDLETPPGQENVDLQDDWFVVSDIRNVLDEENNVRTKLYGYHRDSYREYYISETGAHNVSNFMLPNGERMSNPIPNNDRTMWGFVGHQYTDIRKGDIMQLGYDTEGDVPYYRMLWSSKLKGTKIHVKDDGSWSDDGGTVLVDPGELYEINENPGSADNPNFMSIGYTAYGEVTDTQEGWVRYKTMFVKREDDGSVERTTVQRAIKNENSVYIINVGAGSAEVKKGSASDIATGDKCFIHARDNHCWYMAVIRDE